MPKRVRAWPAAARPLPAGLRQQTELRFVRHDGPNPKAITVLAASRNLQPGQQGAVLTVRGVGNLIGSCSVCGSDFLKRLG